MVHYRKVLSLPKRRPGFPSLDFRTISVEHRQHVKERRDRRIDELAARITTAQQKIRIWKTEIVRLKRAGPHDRIGAKQK